MAADEVDALPLGLFLVIIAPILWSIGSVWSSYVDLPTGSMSTAVQMLAGGLLLGLAGLIAGERITSAPGTNSWLALVYLIGPGSLIAFSAYAYLLRTVRPVLATSYAYVNPVIAVLLGWIILSEPITGYTIVGMILIVAGVYGVFRDKGKRQPPNSEV